MIATKTLNLIPRMKIRGCWCLFDFNKFLKRGLEVAKTTLWAPVCSPSSQAKVTSVNSSSLLSSLKLDKMFSWKSFHFKQSFSEFIFLASLPSWILINYLICLLGPSSGSRHLFGHFILLQTPFWPLYLASSFPAEYPRERYSVWTNINMYKVQSTHVQTNKAGYVLRKML